MLEYKGQVPMKVQLHMYCRFRPMMDALYNMAMAEDSICPEKYKVEGTPTLHEFPQEQAHPNRDPKLAERDEL